MNLFVEVASRLYVSLFTILFLIILNSLLLHLYTCVYIPVYTCVYLHIDKLGRMVKEFFSEIGITGKTNHSLRATGPSARFEANVPEKIIQERTGH